MSAYRVACGALPLSRTAPATLLVFPLILLVCLGCTTQEDLPDVDSTQVEAPEEPAAPVVAADERSEWRALQARIGAALGSAPGLTRIPEVSRADDERVLLRLSGGSRESGREELRALLAPIVEEAGYTLVIETMDEDGTGAEEVGHADEGEEPVVREATGSTGAHEVSAELGALALRLGTTGDLGRDERTVYDEYDPPFAIIRAATGDRPRTYRVRAGDSLSLIAQRTMGSGALWEQLYQHNRSLIGPDPARLVEGMELEIPQE